MSGSYELDSDEERLPEGMTRVGYDADTQQYTFRDADGSYWYSEEGNRFGRLHQSAEAARQSSYTGEGVPDSVRSEDWQLMAPWMLLVMTVLLCIFWLVDSGEPAPPAVECGEGMVKYAIVKGDTCWSIAKEHGMTLDDFLASVKPQIKSCSSLRPAQMICLPG